MKTTKRWYWIVAVLIVVSVILLGACGGSKETPAPSDGKETPAPSGSKETPAPSAGETLLKDRCAQCHSLGRVESKRQTEEQWQQTVTKMVEKGAQLSADEQTTLVTYLAETYAP